MADVKSRVLIVEDDDQYRDFLAELLGLSGYHIQTAVNGKDGLVQFENFEPNLVITDLVMPEVEGIEMLQRLRKQKSDVPVIVLSGGNRGDANSYLKAADMLGAIKTFKKPVDNGELLKAVESILLQGAV